MSAAPGDEHLPTGGPEVEPTFDLADEGDDVATPVGGWMGTLGEIVAAMLVVGGLGLVVLGTLAMLTWIFR